MYKVLTIVFFELLLSLSLFSQKKVAFTFDDVPNTVIYQKNSFHSLLLEKLDSINIPVTIFVNEGKLYKTNFSTENNFLLKEWIKREYVTVGNHTKNHSRYSDVGLDSFITDIKQGEILIKKLCLENGKSLKYFRFPFNDLGKDSLQHQAIIKYLNSENYILAPFTIESSDWMFNFLYEYYLEQGNREEANKIADLYIEKTIEYFNYFDSVSYAFYGRYINQIYLCHDNSINADYIEVLINKIQNLNYKIVSLDEVLADEVYSQSDNYFKKWGISWIYRWMQNTNEMYKLMNNEPSIENVYNIYNALNN